MNYVKCPYCGELTGTELAMNLSWGIPKGDSRDETCQHCKKTFQIFVTVKISTRKKTCRKDSDHAWVSQTGVLFPSRVCSICGEEEFDSHPES